MALQLQTFKPDFTTPPKDTEIQAESYLVKPLIVMTEVTIEPVPIKIKRVYTSAIELYPNSTNNCVAFAKAQTGIEKTLGLGGRLAVEGSTPALNAIIVLKGTPHVGIVKGIENGQITFIESNYKKGWITQRTLPESQAIGYIY